MRPVLVNRCFFGMASPFPHNPPMVLSQLRPLSLPGSANFLDKSKDAL